MARTREQNKARSRKYRENNLERSRQYERDRAARRWANPTEHDKRRARMWFRLYGVTAEFVRCLLALQENACAICRSALTWGKHLHIDHCHETKKVRGILCRACNQAEGHIQDTKLTPIEFGKRLTAYLANPPAKIVELV